MIYPFKFTDSLIVYCCGCPDGMAAAGYIIIIIVMTYNITPAQYHILLYCLKHARGDCSSKSPLSGQIADIVLYYSI